MKPIRRTQVITIMAAMAISIAAGQQSADPRPAPAPMMDQDIARQDAEAARKAQQAERQAQDAARRDMDSARQVQEFERQAQDVDRQRQDAVRQAQQATRESQEAARRDMDSVREMQEAAREAERSIDWNAVNEATRKGLEAERSINWDAVNQATRMAEDALRTVNLAQPELWEPLVAMAQEPTPKPVAPMPPMPPMTPKAFRFYGDSGSYESGKSALENHNYEKAVEVFDRVINARNQSTRIEGAYYWKAYALNKLGRHDEALTALNELTSKYPQSSWINDAKALQAEVQQAKGHPVSPENQADEDLKLYAINALINSDSERAVPLLEGLLSNPKMSPRLKERALFVLAQSRSDKAHQIVGKYAKGGSNPDLQLAAVQYLGTYRTNESRQLLAEVYSSVNDVNVKRAVLRSYEMSRDLDHLAAIAKSEQNVELRREAIRQLGNMHDDQATAALVADYGTESDRDIKQDILRSLRNQQAVKQIIECAKKESDPELKKEAIRLLSEMRSKEATDYLMEILK